jgi:hypothetical protein
MMPCRRRLISDSHGLIHYEIPNTNVKEYTLNARFGAPCLPNVSPLSGSIRRLVQKSNQSNGHCMFVFVFEFAVGVLVGVIMRYHGISVV